MVDNPLNREKTAVLPNVVPARFSPVPEQYAAPVTQELRSKQSRLAQGYITGRIEALQNQLHKGLYKRDPYWREYSFEGTERMYSQEQSDDMLNEAIRIAQTAGTVMKDRIQEWAGNLSEVELEAALSDIWNGFVQIVQEPAEEAEEIEASALAPEDMEPAVADRPEIPDDAPKSEVVAPDEISLGDILGKISEDNTKD